MEALTEKMSGATQAGLECLAGAGQVERQVMHPRAWWRESVYQECKPCVTVDPEEAERWRAAGLRTLELTAAPADAAQVGAHWPIARLEVANDGAGKVATMYAPSLPEGYHDVWCVPVEATERIDRLAAALAALREVVIRQNRLGASWHGELFGDLMAALADAQACLRVHNVRVETTAEAGAVSRGTENVHRTCGPAYSACRSGSARTRG